jgi:hypothetical protein
VLAEPDQRLALDLAHPLAGQAHLLAHLGQGAELAVVEAVAPGEHEALALGEHEVERPCIRLSSWPWIASPSGRARLVAGSAPGAAGAGRRRPAARGDGVALAEQQLGALLVDADLVGELGDGVLDAAASKRFIALRRLRVCSTAQPGRRTGRPVWSMARVIWARTHHRA